MAHLLLIEDPALIPRQVRQASPVPAHAVEVAATGDEGLRRVRAKLPDVILLDLRLPDHSGLEVYQEIRRIDARIPVVLITSARSADAAIEAMRHGAYDYLFKPLDLEQLRRVVGACRLHKDLGGAAWLLGLSGLLSVVIGIAMALMPAAGLLAIAWLIGANALASGVLCAVASKRMRAA